MTAALPAGAPAVGRRPGARLRPAPPAVPHGRLGVLWALVTAAAVFGGSWSLAAWMSAGAVAAVLAVARSRRQPPARALAALLVAGGGPLAAAGGGPVLAGFMAGAVLVGTVWTVVALRIGSRQARGPARSGLVSRWGRSSGPAVLVPLFVTGIALGLTGGCLVLLDRRSVTLVALVLILVACHDASRYLVGWGAPLALEGTFAGLAALGSATLVVAVVQPSPVSGAYTWLFGAAVALGALVGRPLCRRLEGPARRRTGGVGPLRRYATLLVAAPACLALAAYGHL